MTKIRDILWFAILSTGLSVEVSLFNGLGIALCVILLITSCFMNDYNQLKG